MAPQCRPALRPPPPPPLRVAPQCSWAGRRSCRARSACRRRLRAWATSSSRRPWLSPATSLALRQGHGQVRSLVMITDNVMQGQMPACTTMCVCVRGGGEPFAMHARARGGHSMSGRRPATCTLYPCLNGGPVLSLPRWHLLRGPALRGLPGGYALHPLNLPAGLVYASSATDTDAVRKPAQAPTHEFHLCPLRRASLAAEPLGFPARLAAYGREHGRWHAPRLCPCLSRYLSAPSGITHWASAQLVPSSAQLYSQRTDARVHA